MEHRKNFLYPRLRISISQPHRSQLLLDHNPTLTGRLILQDRPEVVSELSNLPPRIEPLIHSYFEPQPPNLHNARIYHLRQILHNNTHTDCIRILKALLPSMGPDSVLMVDEKVMPDKSKSVDDDRAVQVAQASMAMLAFFNTVERRRDQWEGLLEEGGYRVVEVKKYADTHDSIIVARKKEE